MSERLGSSASPPGPLSANVERRRLAGLLFLLAAAGCSPTKPGSVSADSVQDIPANVVAGADSAVAAAARVSVGTGHPGLRGEIEWFYDWYLVELATSRNVD